jgi:hypothetical protein
MRPPALIRSLGASLIHTSTTAMTAACRHIHGASTAAHRLSTDFVASYAQALTRPGITRMGATTRLFSPARQVRHAAKPAAPVSPLAIPTQGSTSPSIYGDVTCALPLSGGAPRRTVRMRRTGHLECAPAACNRVLAGTAAHWTPGVCASRVQPRASRHGRGTCLSASVRRLARSHDGSYW